MRFGYFEINQSICRQCGACVRVCPDGAIVETEGKRYEIDASACSDCGMCRDACKLRAIVRRKGIRFS